MIGAIVFQLKAEQGGKLPVVQGRLLHAAFFQMLKSYSVELATCVHDNIQGKLFTLSELKLHQKPNRVDNSIFVREGDLFQWRITVLADALLKAVLAVPEGYLLWVGSMPMRIEKIIVNGSENAETGVLDVNELIAVCLSIKTVQRITFNFVSPVSFRSFHDDYPFPLPQLIFGSIADKWNQTGMPIAFEKEEIREMAAKILPEVWEGRTKQIFFKFDRGVTGFTGKFTFNVSMLPANIQQLFLLLAQFSVFSGVGRLTGQGMGQTRVTYQ